MPDIILIAHNLRSSHNVGSLLRTAEGLGINKVYLTGYTPFPLHDHDPRMPHLALKIHKQIIKTALGAESTMIWEQVDDIVHLITSLRSQHYTIAALEQSTTSLPLPSYTTTTPVALIVGREVEGIEPEVLALTDVILEIPMAGQKESYNVAQAAAMALYHLKYFSSAS